MYRYLIILTLFYLIAKSYTAVKRLERHDSVRKRYLEDLKTHCTNLRDSFNEIDSYRDLKQNHFIDDYKELAHEVIKYLPELRTEL